MLTLQVSVISSLTCSMIRVPLTTFQDIAQMHNKKDSQVDIAVFDFSKSFYMVHRDGLLSKLMHYGIDDNIWLWINCILKQET